MLFTDFIFPDWLYPTGQYILVVPKSTLIIAHGFLFAQTKAGSFRTHVPKQAFFKNEACNSSHSHAQSNRLRLPHLRASTHPARGFCHLENRVFWMTKRSTPVFNRNTPFTLNYHQSPQIYTVCFPYRSK